MGSVIRDDLYSRYFRFVNKRLAENVEIVNNNPNSARKYIFLLDFARSSVKWVQPYSKSEWNRERVLASP